MKTIESSLAVLGASLALMGPAVAEASGPAPNPNPEPTAEQTDLCVRQALGFNQDGTPWNPANSVGEDFPSFKRHPRVLRITNLFGPEVDNFCEAKVIASRTTVVTPYFQRKGKGAFFRVANPPAMFGQLSNPSLTGLEATDPKHPESDAVFTSKVYKGGDILLKVTTTVITNNHVPYQTKGLKRIKPDGTASVAMLPH